MFCLAGVLDLVSDLVNSLSCFALLFWWFVFVFFSVSFLLAWLWIWLIVFDGFENFWLMAFRDG